MKLKNKKSSLGSTLTWIVAAFVILFIMVLYFVALSFSYSKSTKTSATVIDLDSSRLGMTKALVRFFELSSGDVKIANRIGDWADNPNDKTKETLGKSVSGFFNKYSCYALNIKSGTKEITPHSTGFSNYGGRLESGQVQSDLEKKGINFILVSDKGNLINIDYYGGLC